MKKVLSVLLAAAMATGAATASAPKAVRAENPLAQNVYTADPAPMVYNDTVYLYTSHDADTLIDNFYTMPNWQCYSSTDMKNWTHHGTIMEDTDFSWAKENSAWAVQCIERNGKFYLYAPLEVAAGGGRGIGVAVADSPEGPFRDAIGKPLVGPNWDYIDPTVYIDDDGQAYLYFGNPSLYYVKLNDDMISYSGSIVKTDMDKFNTNGTKYTEGPWFYKRDGKYYMVYASQGVPESISYSMSDSPTGPWTPKGVIMPSGQAGLSFTIHSGICDYKDHSYFFYHNQKLSSNGFQRSVAVEEFTYNSDGTIPKILQTDNGPDQLESLDPFTRCEGETACYESGVETEKCSEGGMDACNIENGDYIKVAGVNFAEGAEKFTVSAASATDGGSIELRLDKKDGTLIGTCDISGTDGWQKWQEFTCDTDVSGEHDLYLVFKGGSGYLFNVDWWKFDGAGSASQGSSDESGILFSSSFEKGIDSWSGRGSASVALSSDEAYNSGKSAYVTGREAAWNGIGKNLPTSKFKAGQTYSFSSEVKYTSGPDAALFHYTLSYKGSDDVVRYKKIDSQTVEKGKWAQLCNKSFTIPSDASEAYIYVETEGSGTANLSFYVDDLVGAVENTEIEGAGRSPLAAYIPAGDVNCNGRIDILDLAAARKGLISGFDKSFYATAADADKSGECQVNDIVLINEYLLGLTTEFPDNTPVPPVSDYEYDPAVSYKEAPSDYYRKDCQQAGRVIKETYTGINGQNTLNVYLPYNYDPEKKYNIFYLMHGGGENENTVFGTDVEFDRMLDHMIMNNEIDPMIVVTPTFNKASAEKVWDEVKQSIVPFVESKYSTYAENTTPEGLEASRMHRAYGGFSMGAGSTWNVLINDINYFGYFMPLSGHCWGGAQAVINAVEGSKYKNSTYIFAATGTEDIAYGNMVPLINSLKNSSTFTYTSDFSKGNLYFLEAQGNTHWWGVVRHYIYDGLPSFFHEGQ